MAIAVPRYQTPDENEIYYPDGDGKPMAASDLHWDERAAAETERANAEARARVEAEAEIARLRTELEALRKQSGAS